MGEVAVNLPPFYHIDHEVQCELVGAGAGVSGAGVRVLCPEIILVQKDHHAPAINFRHFTLGFMRFLGNG